jgi:DNA repair protein RecO (recombination protein O)
MRTARSAPYPTRAIVLRVRPLGEKDRVLTLFAPEIGRFSAVARGSRGTKSKLSAMAQPFVAGRFLLAHGKTFDVLTQGEIENSHRHLSSQLLGAAWAAYWCEMLDALPERHPEDDLFSLLLHALDALDALCERASPAPDFALPPMNASSAVALAPTNADFDFAAQAHWLGHWFEARFLALQGFPSQIGRCVACDAKIVVAPSDAGAQIAFSTSRGGTLCANCVRLDPARTSVLASSLRALHRLERAEELPEAPALSPRNAGELRDLLRRALQAHLDIRPRSRRFLDGVSHS